MNVEWLEVEEFVLEGGADERVEFLRDAGEVLRDLLEG